MNISRREGRQAIKDNMKYLFLILITTNVFASNWMPLSKIQALSSQAYQLESDCKKQSQEQCLDVGNSPEIVSLGFTSLTDKFSKSQVEACLDADDCETKFQALICEDSQETSIKNLDLLEVYCSKFLYKELAINSAGFSAYQANKLAAAQMAGAFAQAKSLRECGGKVMDLLLIRNAPKGLTTSQIKQMVLTYAPIKGLLETGSLNSAKEEIQAITPDGLLVTAGDKTALIAKVDECIGGN